MFRKRSNSFALGDVQFSYTKTKLTAETREEITTAIHDLVGAELKEMTEYEERIRKDRPKTAMYGLPKTTWDQYRGILSDPLFHTRPSTRMLVHDDAEVSGSQLKIDSRSGLL